MLLSSIVFRAATLSRRWIAHKTVRHTDTDTHTHGHTRVGRLLHNATKRMKRKTMRSTLRWMDDCRADGEQPVERETGRGRTFGSVLVRVCVLVEGSSGRRSLWRKKVVVLVGHGTDFPTDPPPPSSASSQRRAPSFFIHHLKVNSAARCPSSTTSSGKNHPVTTVTPLTDAVNPPETMKERK